MSLITTPTVAAFPPFHSSSCSSRPLSPAHPPAGTTSATSWARSRPNPSVVAQSLSALPGRSSISDPRPIAGSSQPPATSATARCGGTSCHALAEKMLPNATEPVGYLDSRWGTDPNSLGSYSCDLVGKPADLYERFRAPVDNIYFAGEATSLDHSGTMHGAYSSAHDQDTVSRSEWRRSRRRRRQEDIIGLLRKMGQEVSCSRSSYEHEFFTAVQSGDLELVKLALRRDLEMVICMILVVIGMAGFALDEFPQDAYNSWSLKRISEFGYARLHATKDDLKVEF